MKQQTLATAADQGAGFEQYRRSTKRDVFLATMNEIVSWRALYEVIEPHYPKRDNGRPPMGLERVPNGTTLLKFRRLLEKHQLGEKLFATVGQVLQARGLKVGTGTIVDATIVGAPSSTKNADKARDPEMHQTRKGQQWYFGMKMHIGVDSRTGLAHSAVVTAANVHDKHPLPDLLHGNERRVYGDSAYASQKALIEAKAPRARDFTNQRARRAAEQDPEQRAKNRSKSRVRARVEHVFAVVKRLWGLRPRVCSRRSRPIAATWTACRRWPRARYDQDQGGPPGVVRGAWTTPWPTSSASHHRPAPLPARLTLAVAFTVGRYRFACARGRSGAAATAWAGGAGRAALRTGPARQLP